MQFVFPVCFPLNYQVLSTTEIPPNPLGVQEWGEAGSGIGKGQDLCGRDCLGYEDVLTQLHQSITAYGFVLRAGYGLEPSGQAGSLLQASVSLDFQELSYHLFWVISRTHGKARISQEINVAMGRKWWKEGSALDGDLCLCPGLLLRKTWMLAPPPRASKNRDNDLPSSQSCCEVIGKGNTRSHWVEGKLYFQQEFPELSLSVCPYYVLA